MRRVFAAALLLALSGLAIWLVVRRGLQRPAQLPAVDVGSGASLPPVEAADLPDILVDPRLLIEKADRKLTVISAGQPVKSYRIALGFAPSGDKQEEGDGKTPLGEFYICTKNPESRHRRALGISYPSASHAERGLEMGLITKRQHRTIIEALRHYERPPWHTPLGGEIMVHGGGTAADWTQGCIAVTDDQAEELYNALPMGTPVDIVE